MQEGDIGAGDAIELSHRDKYNVTVADVVQIYRRASDEDLVHRALQVPALAAELRSLFQQQIETGGRDHPPASTN